MATGLKLHSVKWRDSFWPVSLDCLLVVQASKSLREFGYFGALAASLFAISAAGNETLPII
jgi:hypothetical protein